MKTVLHMLQVADYTLTCSTYVAWKKQVSSSCINDEFYFSSVILMDASGPILKIRKEWMIFKKKIDLI